MEEKASYVPPKYVPLHGSDTEVQTGAFNGGQNLQTLITQNPNQWSSGLCACFDDIPSCCMGTICPCFLFGKNAEFLGSGTFSGSCGTHCILWGLLASLSCILTGGILFLLLPGSTVACYACGYRKALREKYNLPESPCGDYATHLCCHLCAICQEYREIRERSNGSDLTIGSSIVTPPQVQSMH